MATGGKTGATKAGKAANRSVDKVEGGTKVAKGLSPNPITNLIIADIVLRGGGRLLRHVVERTLLGVKNPPDKARKTVKGRSMTRTLVGSAVARVAIRSVPGALLVGGGLLAKALYDRSKKRGESKTQGAKAVEDQTEGA